MKEVVILLVEDSPEDAFIMKRNLDKIRIEHTLSHASSFDEVKEMIKNTTFDCILLDYQLPDANGIEILKYLRLEILELTAVIMITGSGNEQIAVESMKAGADDYIAKNQISPLRMQNAISQAIQNLKLEATIKRQNLELSKYVRELKRSNESLQQFAYVASHDMRQPLRMIKSYMQLINERYIPQLDDDAQDFMNFALDGAIRLDHFIEDLLKYSRVNNTKLDMQEIDTNELIKSLVTSLSLPIEDAKAYIEVCDLPNIYGDETLLWQLFQNLLTNAIKFRGDKPPKIQIGGEMRQDHVQFYVKDNGIGISEENFENLFVMFSRLNSKTEFEGTGIGLSTCKSIVDRLNGEIWVESKIAVGTTFFFKLPKQT